MNDLKQRVIHIFLLCSLGLVFWEMARRTKSLDGATEDYAQPYFEVVDADPALDDMRRAVCDKGFRPTVPDRWQETEVIMYVNEFTQCQSGSYEQCDSSTHLRGFVVIYRVTCVLGYNTIQGDLRTKVAF